MFLVVCITTTRGYVWRGMWEGCGNMSYRPPDRSLQPLLVIFGPLKWRFQDVITWSEQVDKSTCSYAHPPFETQDFAYHLCCCCNTKEALWGMAAIHFSVKMTPLTGMTSFQLVAYVCVCLFVDVCENSHHFPQGRVSFYRTRYGKKHCLWYDLGMEMMGRLHIPYDLECVCVCRRKKRKKTSVFWPSLDHLKKLVESLIQQRVIVLLWFCCTIVLCVCKGVFGGSHWLWHF